MQAKRVVFQEPSPEQLQKYSGRYDNSELGSSFSVSVRDGKLVATHSRHPDMRIISTGPDKFSGESWWFGDLAFKRDADGNIFGLEVRGARIKPVLFLRQ